MDIRLHQLEGFYYTGLVGGYARAAAAMPYPVSAPAVYQQVRKLEGALGVPLVALAKTRRTVLTPEGRALHDFVTPFFAGLPAVLDAVQRREARRLLLAGDGALARALAAPALATLGGNGPQGARTVEVRFSEHTSPDVVRLVGTGEADAGLAILGFAGDGFREEALLVVRVVLCVPKDHALAKRRTPPRPADLDGVALCVYPRGDPGRAILESRFREAGIAFRVAAEASTADMLRALVASGLAPAFVPVAVPAKRGGQRPVRHEDGVTMFDMTDHVPGEPTRFGLVTRDGPSHPAVSELRRLLEREAATF